MNFSKFYEDVNDITQNPKFISWFKGSKIINSDGSPKIVYHGSNAKFDAFNYKNLGTKGRSEGVGFYFTNEKEEALAYGKVLYEVYLSIKKPILFTAKMFTRLATQRIVQQIVNLEKSMMGIEKDMGLLSNYGDINSEPFLSVVRECVDSLLLNDTAIDFQSELVNIGVNPLVVNTAIYQVTKYDGIISKGYNAGYGNILEGNITIYIPFFPNQIKSINNSGEFSKSDNIYEDGGYMEGHTAPTSESGKPLYNLEGIYPDDIYGPDAVRLYSTEESYDSESILIIKSAKNRPNKPIRIYRAIPNPNYELDKEIKKWSDIISYWYKWKFYPTYTHNMKEMDIDTFTPIEDIEKKRDELMAKREPLHKINSGDWVTISKAYAIDHGKSNLGGKYKVITKLVKAKNLFTDGNSIHEWGYEA